MARILVIDDDEGPREALCFVLKQDYKILVAASVNEGIALLKKNKIDLIISDIKMPGKSGIEGLAEIRQLDHEVPVIMLTGYGDLASAQQAIRLQASDYLTKPFDAQVLLNLVSSHIERHKYQLQKREAEKTISDNIEAMMAELTTLKEAAEKGELTAQIMHDFNNPLLAITGYIDLLSDLTKNLREKLGGDFKEFETYIQFIQQGANQCCELTNKWRQGHQEGIKHEGIVLDDFIKELVMLFEPLSWLESVTLNVYVEDGKTLFKGDKMQLVRVFHNLVSNALFAMKHNHKKELTLSASMEDAWVKIEVEDNGSGIPKELRPYIFDQKVSTKPSEQGSGLGLYISKRIVEEEHHGKLELIKSSPSGTLFGVRIPAG